MPRSTAGWGGRGEGGRGHLGDPQGDWAKRPSQWSNSPVGAERSRHGVSRVGLKLSPLTSCEVRPQFPHLCSVEPVSSPLCLFFLPREIKRPERRLLYPLLVRQQAAACCSRTASLPTSVTLSDPPARGGRSPGSQMPRPSGMSRPASCFLSLGLEEHLVSRQTCSCSMGGYLGPGESSFQPRTHRAYLFVLCRGLRGGEQGGKAHGLGPTAPEEALAGMVPRL